MKTLIKIPLFTYFAIVGTQFLLSPFNFGSLYNKNLGLLVVALSLFFLLKRPILKILTFPFGCLGTGLLSLILIAVLLLALTVVLPEFSFNDVDKLNLINFEIMLPFKSYGMAGSLVIASFFVSLIFNILDWLCSCHR